MIEAPDSSTTLRALGLQFSLRLYIILAMTTELKRKPDKIDAALFLKRRLIILRMIDNGRLDVESGMELYESMASPEAVAREREALEKDDFGPNSPLGILLNLYCKLAPQDRKGQTSA